MKLSAVVVGSGPNGLSAAIHLARNGFDVQVRECAPELGGGARSAQITLPGFVHDLGSAVHPMAVCSPFFQSLPLHEHGLRWIFPPAPLAHPLDDGTAVMLEKDLAGTAKELGPDGSAYRKLYAPLVKHWQQIMSEVLRPMPKFPRHPFLLAGFGIRAIQPATVLAKSLFKGERARALFAGIAAHSILKLEWPLSSAFGMILGGSGHAVGWPVPQGGSQSISNALASVLHLLGGRVLTNSPVTSFDDLGNPDLLLCDVTPRQFLAIAENRLPRGFRKALGEYRYGPGIFKVDYALREPIPWRAKECLRAGTVHLGGTLDEIAASERAAWESEPPSKPFLLLAQQSLFDPSRAPDGQHTAWVYCHVPNGWSGSALQQMEAQIERFAPGFRECVLARAVHTPADLQHYNPNLIGGDINGGSPDIIQFVLRPTWRQYGTPLKGVYLCSSSTPPGGGVHGMCGYNAARRALSWFRGRVRISGS
ncbi:MAG: NAD(P)/FAD-dependent oxidoreductase [Acidobacteriaceae bacterium]|nr:NAD(P)/FAD-dependent oxidoreductase [Acidobacteriaceae bacterium]